MAVDSVARGIARDSSVGPAGDSAYAVAVTNGFVGTEAQWLASLEGADGAPGAGGAPGGAGTPGADGNSVLHGSAAPTTEGVDGDFYIQTVTGIPTYIFGPKTGGLWGGGTELQGEQGIPGPPPDFEPSSLASGGQVAWTGTGYNYRVSAASYYIEGAPYTSIEQTITLDASDGTNPRIDVIALDNTGTVVKITGTPSSAPSEPSIDPVTQLQLTFVSVPAGSTEPPIVAPNEIIYEENDGVSEWTGSILSGAAIVLGDTTNPRTGTKCIRATSATQTSAIRLNKGSTLNRDNYIDLVFFIRSALSSWGTGQIRAHFQNASGQRVGSILGLRSGLFGFNSNNITTYQQVAIPLSQFNIPAGTLIQYLHITGSGGAISYALDDITLTPAASTGGNNADFLLKASNLSDVANATTARTNLGARAAAIAIQSVVSNATVTPTFANDQVNITAQAAALNLANPTGTAMDGWGISVRIKDNGTARAITFGTQYRAIGVTLPTTTVISKTLYLGMIYNVADTKWDVVAVAQEA